MLAKIYRPSKTAMQSGRGGAKSWVLEFEATDQMRPDQLMGWQSSADTNGQVRLTFDTAEAAIEFARANNIPHQLITPREPKRIIKAYGDNFSYYRREPWSH